MSFLCHCFKASHIGHLSARLHDLRNLHLNIAQTRVRKEGERYHTDDDKKYRSQIIRKEMIVRFN